MVSTSRVASAMAAACMLIMAREHASAYTFFSIEGYPVSNALGIAVDPLTGSTLFTSLSYGGEHNLYEFNAAGAFVRSTRVPFDLGMSGNLGKMVMGGNGHLFIETAHGALQSNGSWVYTYSIIEVSRNGSTVFSSIANANAHAGMSLDPASGNLLYIDYRANYALMEVTTGGAFVRSQTLGQLTNHIYDIAYDAAGQKLFLSERYGVNLLHEYQRDELGQFAYLKTYSMDTIPILEGVMAIDFNSATGKFYAQDDNERVIIFGLDELQVVPEPGVLSLLGFGSLVLVWAKRRSRL